MNLRRAVVRAMSAKLRRVPERGGAVLFLPLPLRRAAAALSLALLFGCTSAAKTVATHQNSYDFREARYEEHCVAGAIDIDSMVECGSAFAELRAYEKHLHEAARALKLGGGMPLQLGALKADAKKLKARKVAR